MSLMIPAATLLNERELVKRFKRPVRSKDPKLVTIQMESETAGQKETFSVFCDAADPYAKLVVQQEWGEDRAGLLLDEDKHAHRQQAVETANAENDREPVVDTDAAANFDRACHSRRTLCEDPWRASYYIGSNRGQELDS